MPTVTVTAADIDAAAARIAPHIRRTPLWVLPSAAFALPAGGPPFEVWLKLEHLQRGGSFKARGMFNRLLGQPIPASGVIAASGGNAGIATALAAQALGVHAEIFVPAISSAAKRERLAALGATVVVGGEAYADALAACEARREATGALMTHAYDQPEVVAGAGTLAAEVEAEAGIPDRALVSVGGGGLIAGVAAWFEGRCRIEALEPERAPTLYRARAAGMPVDVDVAGIAADSLGARRIGTIAWDVAQRHVGAAHLLGDDAIRAAQLALWKELRLAVEPAAALPLAALATRTVRPAANEKVLLVICGANLDLSALAA